MNVRDVRGRWGLWALLVVVGCGSEEPQARWKQATQALAQGPDLVVTEVLGPPSVQMNGQMDVQVTVCNQGTDAASPEVDLYLSADAVIHAGTGNTPYEDTRLEGSPLPRLEPNQCFTQRYGVTASPPRDAYGYAVEGPYYVGAVVDRSNRIPESNEDNNTLAGNRIGVGSRPDFLVTSVTGPASVRAGQSLTAQVTVCNQGTSGGSVDFEVYLSTDATIRATVSGQPAEDRLLRGGTTPTLGAGQCVTQIVSGTAAAPSGGGTPADSAYYLGAVVDPRGAVMEFLEDNNALAGSRMGLGAKADFVVTSVTGPTRVVAGQTFTAQVRVCNQGTESANSLVELSLSPDPLLTADASNAPLEASPVGRASLPSLVAGQCANVSVSGPAAVPPSSNSGADRVYVLGAVVDPDKTVAELREDNNTTVGERLGVGRGDTSLPDFLITAVRGPSLVAHGQDFPVQVTVCNQGTSSGYAEIEIYLSADPVLHPQTSQRPYEDFRLNRYFESSSAQPGQCFTHSYTVRAPDYSSGESPSRYWREGSYYLGAVVISRQSNPELRADNNSLMDSRIGLGGWADLTVKSVTGPAVARSGQSITLQVEVCNEGRYPIEADVEAYLSADAIISSNTSRLPYEDRLVGTGTTPVLNAGQCFAQSISGTAVAPTGGSPPADSAYYLGAVVKPRYTSPEIRTDNNTLAGSRMGLGAKADFLVTSVTGPANAETHQNITARVQVCNQGTASASTPVDVYLSADQLIRAGTPSAPTEDSLLGRATLPSLGTGQCARVSVSGPVTVAASSNPRADSVYFLGAVVDPDNAVAELREDNNSLTGERMGVGALPDFVVIELKGDPSLSPYGTFNYQYTVCNQGSRHPSEYPSVEVSAYLSTDTTLQTGYQDGADLFLGQEYLSVDPGRCVTRQLSVSAPRFPGSSDQYQGTYYLLTQVNQNGYWSELRRDNNLTVGSRTAVGYAPDLVITSVTGPASTPSGQAIAVEATVCNQGTASADPSPVEFYLSADNAIHAPTQSPYTPSEDNRLGDAVNTPPLLPEQCAIVSVTAPATPPAASGSSTDSAYYLGAVVNPNQPWLELRADNNATAGERIGVGARSDIVVTAVKGPLNVSSGQNLSVQVTACNQGTASGSTTADVYLSSDTVLHTNTSALPFEDLFLGSSRAFTLAVGQCLTLPVTGSVSLPTTANAYHLGAVADPRNALAELRDDNNTLIGNRMSVGTLADFVVTSISNLKMVKSNSSYYSDMLSVVVTVCNRGQASANTNVTLFLVPESEKDLPREDSAFQRHGSTYLDLLAPGVCVSRPLTFSGSQSSGIHRLGALVDDYQSVPELLEDNNRLLSPYTLITERQRY